MTRGSHKEKNSVTLKQMNFVHVCGKECITGVIGCFSLDKTEPWGSAKTVKAVRHGREYVDGIVQCHRRTCIHTLRSVSAKTLVLLYH